MLLVVFYYLMYCICICFCYILINKFKLIKKKKTKREIIKISRFSLILLLDLTDLHEFK